MTTIATDSKMDAVKKERKAEANLKYNSSTRELNNERDKKRRDEIGDEINAKRQCAYPNSDEQATRAGTYELNKEHILTQQKKYRESVKDERNEKQRETMDCICGITHREQDWRKHRKTVGHQKFLDAHPEHKAKWGLDKK